MPVEPCDAERFDRLVDFSGPDGCWIWRGSTTGNGYAQFRTGHGRSKRQVGVHRWNYERHIGPIAAGFHVDHLCRNPLCVNPDHLEAVAPAVNNARSDSPSALNARMELCKYGLHELSGENLHPSFLKNGVRRCRPCFVEYMRAYRARQKLQRSRTGVAE